MSGASKKHLKTNFVSIDENCILKETEVIQTAMSVLGRQLESGDISQLVYWVIPRQLACAHRPLRHDPNYGGSGRNISVSATYLVREWVTRIREEGINSLISLMHDRDLNCYKSLDLDADSLLDFFTRQGLNVSHIPWEDPLHKKSNSQEKLKMLLEIRDKALLNYRSMPKPVLIQCSAGIDRSAPVAAFIKCQEAKVTK